MQEQSLFIEALEKRDPAERAAFLERACANDPGLRQRIERLLERHQEAGSFLEAPAVAPNTTADEPAGEVAGTCIGPYQLLQMLGEGGMGAVWMAEQTEPVQRRVAVKLIKAGMDSARVIARFEQERQALALMDHPNIARVLDAGATPAGRPYFVMELVKGIPITRFCDHEHLTPRERLELFIPVCQAVQHAHQKGVIHRDLKPSNVLIALYDGKPVPKVIDFGVAKATGQKLTERSLFTEVGVLIGTLEYMAPEQAELNNLDIDTRADIYALGVLLYELLTGSPPFTSQQLRAAAFTEMLRMIREVEPPRPSTRLSSSEELPSIAARRKLEPHRLARLVAGELDWIVMKCLEKDRARRYETANGLAADVQRYLADEPVVAGPPGAAYRLRKFVRRNKRQVVAAAVVLLVLVGGIVGTTFGLIRADQARAAETERAEGERLAKLAAEAQQLRAEAGEKLAGERLVQVEAEKQKALGEKQIAQAVRDFLQHKLLGQADSRTQADALLRAGGLVAEAKENPTIRELLDRAARELAVEKIEANFPDQPLLQAEILRTVGDTYRGIGDYERAIEFLQRSAMLFNQYAGADHLDTLTALHGLAVAYFCAGKGDEAIVLYEQVRNVLVKKSGPDHPDTLVALHNLAWAYGDAGRLNEAIALYEQVCNALLKKPGPDHPDTLVTQGNLAVAYLNSGKVSQAIELLEQVRDAQEPKLGFDHPSTLATLNNLAGAYLAAGKHPQAIALFKQACDALVKKLGADHPFTLTTLYNLAGAYLEAGELNKAIALYEQVRDAQEKKLGADHPATLDTRNGLAGAYKEAGQLNKAIVLYEQVRDARKRRLGADHLHTLVTLHDLARAYFASGQRKEAIALYEQVREARVKKLGADHPATLDTCYDLARAFLDAGELNKAIALYEQIRDAQEKKLGADHPATLTTRNGLAEAYKEAGELKKAIALFEQVREARVKKLGPDHPSTHTTLEGLAGAYQIAGQWKEARALFEQVRDARVRTLGIDHPYTLKTLSRLAGTYQVAGRLKEAIVLYEQVRNAQVKKLGADHPDTLATQSNLALAYQEAGRLEEAIALYEQTRDAQVKKHGAGHPEVLFTLHGLAAVYRVKGRVKEAIDLLEQVREARVQKLGANHPATLATLNSLAAAYWSDEQLDKSIPLFEDVLKRQQATLGRQHPMTQLTVGNLGVNYKDAGRVAAAIPLLEEAYRARHTFPTLNGFGVPLLDAYTKADRPAEAVQLVQELVSEAQKDFPKASPQLAGILAQCSLTLLQFKAYADAESLLRECLSIREKTEPDRWTTFNSKSMLGGALLGQMKYAEAEPLLLTAYEGMKQREKTIPPEWKYRLPDAVDRLVQLYEATDRKDELAKWQKLREVMKTAEKTPARP